MKRRLKGYEEMGVIEKQIGYLIKARVRETDKIRQAIEKQDQMREQHAAYTGWDSTAMVRKWRNAR